MTARSPGTCEAEAAGPDLEALGGFPSRLSPLLGEGAVAAVRGEPPPEGRPLRDVPRALQAAPGKGAELQQHPGHHLGHLPDRRIRAADGRDPQAHQPVRRRQRGHPRRGLGEGLCDRPAGALRRHHHRQPHAGRGPGGADRGDLHRGHHRAALQRRGAGDPREEEEPAPHGRQRGARVPTPCRRSARSSAACSCRTATGRSATARASGW